MLLLTLRDLQFRKARVVVVVVLVSIVLTLLYVMSGLVHQLQTEPERTIESLSANNWVLSDGVDSPFTGASVVPAGLEAALGGDAAPIVVSRSSLGMDDDDIDVIIWGYTDGAIGAPDIAAGRAAASPDEVVVDESAGADIGQVVTFSGRSATVVGQTKDITMLAGIPLLFVGLPVAQDLAFQSDEIVTGYIGSSDLDAVEGTAVVTAERVAAATRKPIEAAIASIDLVRGLLWMVAGIVVGAVVLLSAMERSKDFAILKAVGASGSLLGGGLALQAVLIAVVASVVGAALAGLIQPSFPMPVRVPTKAYWQVPLAAVLVGLLAAAVGVRKVNRTDPSEAFGGAAG